MDAYETRTARLLFVDDEENILHAYRRLFLDEEVEVLTAPDAAAALNVLRGNGVAVVASDNLMPGMSGIELLKAARDVSPDAVRILITAHADVASAVQAINAGEVYKFVTKPWDDALLKGVIADAVERHRTVSSLRKANEAMLRSLAQTIELKDSYTKGHCDRVAEYAVRIAEALGLSEEARRNVRYGSWLHDCGKIGVPESILNFAGQLSPEQMDVVRNHCRWGADVAKLARLPQAVVNIVLHHHERYDGTGYPQGRKGKDIPLEARIVTIADAYDAMTTDRPYRKKTPPEEAREALAGMKGSLFDPEIADVFIRLLGERRND